MKVSVKVPATSANLGPGFDCLGLALPIYNIITIEEKFFQVAEQKLILLQINLQMKHLQAKFLQTKIVLFIKL